MARKRGRAEKGRNATVERVTRRFDGFLKIDEAVVTHDRFDGGRQTVTRLSLERGDSVAALMIDRARRVVFLTEQFRYPTLAKAGGWLRETPAGVIDAGETPEQAARREIEEETGFTIGRIEPIATFFLSPGGSSERIHLFYAETDGAERRAAESYGEAGEGEDIRIEEVAVDTLLRDARAGRIDDAKTLIAALWVLARRRKLGL